ANDQTVVSISGGSASGHQFIFDNSGGTLAQGDWVTPLASDLTKAKRAAPADVVAAGTAFLYADAATLTTNGTVFQAFPSGFQVPHTVFGDVGAGVVADAGMNATGRARRITRKSGGEIILGKFDA